jgi:hypothetical protein
MEQNNTTQVANYLQADSFNQLQRVAKALSASSLVPQDFQGGEKGVANCMIALEMASRMGIGPMTVMQNLYIVHGRPTWKSEFIISMLDSGGKFKNLEFERDNEQGGRCRLTATRIDDGKVLTGNWVSMQLAQSEGWLSRSGSKWKTMPEQMLMYRAATFFARVYAPSLLNGLAPHDEAQDYTPNASSSTADINARIITNDVKFKVSEIEDAELIDDIENDDAAIDEL